MNKSNKWGSVSCLIAAILIAVLSCTPAQPGQVMDRTSVPAPDPKIGQGQSEIRELRYTRIRGENDHKDLHITGQLFTKSASNGSSQITPCSNCIVQLSTPGDTSVRINLTTESDGYFSFEGRNAGYAITLNNAGHNRVEIGPIFFQSEGVTSIRIINAAGTSNEKFIVTKNGKQYNWSLVQ
jgi:hypothetical protein